MCVNIRKGNQKWLVGVHRVSFQNAVYLSVSTIWEINMFEKTNKLKQKTISLIKLVIRI